METSINMDYAPAGDNEYNGNVERRIQRLIKNINDCLSAHLNDQSDVCTAETFYLATIVYNITPHLRLEGLISSTVVFREKVQVESHLE